jgi:hypothetical protein
VEAAHTKTGMIDEQYLLPEGADRIAAKVIISNERHSGIAGTNNDAVSAGYPAK